MYHRRCAQKVGVNLIDLYDSDSPEPARPKGTAVRRTNPTRGVATRGVATRVVKANNSKATSKPTNNGKGKGKAVPKKKLELPVTTWFCPRCKLRRHNELVKYLKEEMGLILVKRAPIPPSRLRTAIT
jgi:hypothetical protein